MSDDLVARHQDLHVPTKRADAPGERDKHLRRRRPAGLRRHEIDADGTDARIGQRAQLGFLDVGVDHGNAA